MAEQIKGIEEAAEKRMAAKRDEKIAVEKDLIDLAKDINERRKVLKSKAATMATELADVPKPPADAVMAHAYREASYIRTTSNRMSCSKQQ